MLRIRPSGGMALQQRAGACLSPMTSSLRVPKLSPRHPRSRRAVRCMASFLPDDLEDILQVGTVVASSLAILGTAALAYRSPRRPPPSPADDDSGQFGVMTVVSCIPLFNWTAWLLPAIVNPERSSLYYSFAALYAYPLLQDGFDIEKYTIVMLILGILHVQVERIANTEPQVIQDIRPVSGLLNVVGALLEGVGKYTRSLFGTVAEDTKQVIRGPGADDGRMYLDGKPLSSAEELELKEFDRQLMARDARKRQQQQRSGRR